MPADTLEDNETTSWLFMTSPYLQAIFLGFLFTSFGLGASRLLLPFAILETGGVDALLSLSSAWFAIGQLVAYLLVPRFIKSARPMAGSILLLLSGFFAVCIITSSPDLLAFARVFEGIALGLMFLLTVKISKEYSNREGEVIGTLLGGVFMGLALGQGLAGVLEAVAESWLELRFIEAIRLVFFLSSVFCVIGMGAIVFSVRGSLVSLDQNEHFSSHAHLSQVLRFLTSPGFLVLGLVYILYDFSHGLYTPTLSIMLNDNGISLEQLGFAYLIGDFTWGVIQIVAGRLVDRVGARLPLAGSLIVKGFLVLLYPQADFFLVVASLLLLAGTAEGFLEPARNKKAMELEGVEALEHSHKHWNIVFGPTAGFEVSQHTHNHTHRLGAEDAVAVLQSIGIVFFAVGALIGAFLLSTGADFIFLTQLGGFVLMAAALPLLLPLSRFNRSGQEETR
ncbi:MAG: MFS transporter [Candidatus Hodarchaeota archaeon]